MSVISATLQATLNQQYDGEAGAYDAQPGHGITVEERELWRADLLAQVKLAANSSILDVGSGTGVFTQLFADWSYTVVGLEPSPRMLAEAEAKLLPIYANRISFVLGDTHEAELFADETFDAIVSRQVACYFQDPLQVFANWRRWLKPGGQVIVIDGLWQRAGWGDEGLVDQLPLSCLQTRATLAYLLEKSGFRITHNDWLAQVNTYLQAANPATSPRYMIVGGHNHL